MKAEFSVQGEVTAVPYNGEVAGKDGKTYRKVEFVIDTTESSAEGKEYPSELAITLFGKNADEFAQYVAIGNMLDVKGIVKSRQYNNKWYHDVSATNVVLVQGVAVTDEPVPAAAAPQQEKLDDSTELPF